MILDELLARICSGQDVVNELALALSSGLDPNTRLHGEYATLLQAACVMPGGHLRMLRVASVLLRHGADPNAPIGSVWPGPLVAAVAIKQHPLIALLLQHGADPNAPMDLESALMRAVDEEDPVGLALLLLHGADNFHELDELGDATPLAVSIIRGRMDLIALLMAAGCPPDALPPGQRVERWISLGARGENFNETAARALLLDDV